MKPVDKVQLMKTLFIFGTIEYRKKSKTCQTIWGNTCSRDHQTKTGWSN